jgi:hypothetical protein
LGNKNIKEIFKNKKGLILKENEDSPNWSFGYSPMKKDGKPYLRAGIKIHELECLSWEDLAKIADENNLSLEKWNISIGQSTPFEFRYVLCSHLDDKIVAKETDPPEEKEKAKERLREISDRLKRAGSQVDKLVSSIKREYIVM